MTSPNIRPVCRFHGLPLLLASCLVLLAGSKLPAQDRSMDIEQSTMQPPIQSGRPMPSWWDVNIRGSALVQGRLEFKLMNDDRLVETVTTEELALTGPQQRIRVLLPPINDQFPIEQLQLKIRFLGKDFEQDLGSHILRVPQIRIKTFMILTPMSRLGTRKSKARDTIVQSLAFESLAVNLGEAVSSITIPLEPADLPQEPMAYCAYELVVLAGNEFRLMQKPQLEAMASWIRAGGSLYLEPTNVLESYHVDFLRNITASGPSGLVIQPDSQGRLLPGTLWNDDRWVMLSPGLGRVVLHLDDVDHIEPKGSENWRRASTFLWKIHSEQALQILKKPDIGINQLLMSTPNPTLEFPPGGVPQPPMAVPGNGMPVMSGYRLNLSLPTWTSDLVEWLMPAGVQMVPIWVLGLILISFIIWIGPVEYLVLGRLSARKLTWITFPLATVLVTGLTVFITNQYMSSAETRRGMIIRDLGDDGAVVRTNRFELLFIASSRNVTTDVRKGVFSPLATGQAFSNDPYQRALAYQQRQLGQYEPSNRTSAQLTGRVPTEFTATQNLTKWTPQLNRVFWIPGPPEETEVDWDALLDGITPSEMFSTRAVNEQLHGRVQQRLGANALVACLGDHGKWALSRGNWNLANSGSDLYYNDASGLQGFLPADMYAQPILFRWLYLHSVAPSYGIFSLASQVGPIGGAHLDDLPILDGTDPNQWLLIVVVPKGDDLVVYRKLLRQE